MGKKTIVLKFIGLSILQVFLTGSVVGEIFFLEIRISVFDLFSFIEAYLVNNAMIFFFHFSINF